MCHRTPGVGHPFAVIRLADGDPLDWLPGDLCDELEVLVQVQDGELAQFGCGRYQEVGDRCGAVLATLCQDHLDLDRSVFHRRCQVFPQACEPNHGPVASLRWPARALADIAAGGFLLRTALLLVTVLAQVIGAGLSTLC